MIYLVTALYCEAQMFIEHFSLKKVMENTRFQQFASESGQILLTVSGVGEIAAASAVSSVCAKDPPGSDDFLMNVGICAAQGGQDGIFLIHKLTEQTTGKTFYPDMLYRHGFNEAELVTGMTVWKRHNSGRTADGVQLSGQDAAADGVRLSERCLYDMEAAGVYQAGAYFFAPHQMQFLKVVSDQGEAGRLSGETVRQLMEAHREKIFAYMQQLLQQAPHQSGQKDSRMEQWMDRLCADMHCSKAMEDRLRQYVRYAFLAGIDWQQAATQMYAQQWLPCRDKREGKKCFEQFKQRLLSAVSITHICGEAGTGSSAHEDAAGTLSGSAGD